MLVLFISMLWCFRMMYVIEEYSHVYGEIGYINIVHFIPATLHGDNNCSAESVTLFNGVFVSSLLVDIIRFAVPAS